MKNKTAPKKKKKKGNLEINALYLLLKHRFQSLGWVHTTSLGSCSNSAQGITKFFPKEISMVLTDDNSEHSETAMQSFMDLIHDL